MFEKRHTDTRGSPSKGTRRAATAREQVFRPPITMQPGGKRDERGNLKLVPSVCV